MRGRSIVKVERGDRVVFHLEYLDGLPKWIDRPWGFWRAETAWVLKLGHGRAVKLRASWIRWRI